MAVAVAKAIEDGAEGVDLRLDREHGRLGGRLRGARRADRGRALPRRSDRGGQAGAVACGRRARARGARQLRPGDGAAASSSSDAAASCSSTRSTPTASKGRRRRPSRSSSSSDARRTCSRSPTAAGATSCAYAKGFAEEGVLAARASRPKRARRASTLASAIRIVDPAHPRGGRGDRRARAEPRSLSLGDDEITSDVARARKRRGRLLRALLGRGRRRRSHTSRSSPAPPLVCVLTGHGLKDTGSGGACLTPGARPRRAPASRAILAEVEASMSDEGIVFRSPSVEARTSAPASTAPRPRSSSGTSFGFEDADSARAGRLDRGRGRRRAPLSTSSHFALRAFALTSSLEGRRCASSTGSRSSAASDRRAASIAAGLVAGLRALGHGRSRLDHLLELGAAARGPPTTSRRALRGGVCLIWRKRRAPPHAAARRATCRSRRSSSCPRRA